MIDLQQLKNAQGQLASNNPRHTRGEELFLCGVAALELFQQTGFERIELAKQACTDLIEAIKYNHRDERPCLALAVLFFLLGDSRTAVEYFTLAREIFPDNPLLPGFRDLFSGKTRESEGDGPEAQSEPEAQSGPEAQSEPSAVGGPVVAEPAEKDPDLRAAQLERQIRTLLRSEMERPLPLPAPLPERIEALSAAEGLLAEQCLSFRTELVPLDRALDVSGLHRLLRPLEVCLDRYRKAMTCSQELVALRTEMLAQIRQVQISSREAEVLADPAQIPALENGLEALLDHCDSFADRLDRFEAQQADLQLLVETYERLIAEVDEFRSRIDDTVVRLQESA